MNPTTYRQTPWGPAQTRTEAPGGLGIYTVTTSTHGGAYVPTEHLHRIPAEARAYAAHWTQSENWYEEDVAALAPMVAFPEAFPDIPTEKRAAMAEALAGYIARHAARRASPRPQVLTHRPRTPRIEVNQ